MTATNTVAAHPFQEFQLALQHPALMAAPKAPKS